MPALPPSIRGVCGSLFGGIKDSENRAGNSDKTLPQMSLNPLTIATVNVYNVKREYLFALYGKTVMQYQKEEVRQRIIDAAFNEFEKNGFYRASMLQISSKAKVPIGNLYRYFKGKEALFHACVADAYELSLKIVDSVFDKWLSEGSEYVAETADYTVGLLAELSESHSRSIRLLAENSSGSEYANFFNEITELGYKKLAEAFAKGAEPDEYLLKIIARNVAEGVLVVLTRCPSERQRQVMFELLIFYFKDLGARVGGNFK